MEIFAGIDIGSLTSKALLFGEKGILSYSILPTGANPKIAAMRCLESVLMKSNIKEKDILSIVATGYGRIIIPFKAKEMTEISCHAKGASFLIPGARTVIDIGGQDSKIITLDSNSRVLDFVMNDKCAAGTGRFLEVMAKALEVELNEMGRLSLQSRKSISVSSMCTVFAESEVISLIAKGYEVKEILKGLHEAIARRIYNLSKRLRVKDKIVFTGGVAKNEGIKRFLEKFFGKEILVPEEPQIVGALGAALFARDFYY